MGVLFLVSSFPRLNVPRIKLRKVYTETLGGGKFIMLLRIPHFMMLSKGFQSTVVVLCRSAIWRTPAHVS